MPRKLTQEQFIKRANEVHNFKYDYSRVIYIIRDKKVDIICPEHGLFSQHAGSHLKGADCYYCGLKKLAKHFAYSTEEFIKQAILTHGDLYDYSMSNYKKGYLKTKIICKKHGVFEQIADSHLSGHGCSKCKSSRGEAIIQNYLKKTKIKYFSQYRFIKGDVKRKFFDFYLPDYKLIIEYNGQQHYYVSQLFGGVEAYKNQRIRDNQKKAFAKRNHYHFLEIPYFSKNPLKMIEDKIKEINVLNKEIIDNQTKLF